MRSAAFALDQAQTEKWASDAFVFALPATVVVVVADAVEAKSTRQLTE